MDTVTAAYQDFQQWSEGLSTKIIDYVDPSGVTKLSPTKNYPMAQLHEALLVDIAYILFVVFGTLIMRSESVKPVNLRWLQFLYNPAQIILCSYMCVEAGIQAYRNGYSMTPCNAFNAANPPLGNLLWLFYISKIFDFLDTVFIILGKKWNQLSFLHVYHHLTIFTIYWLNLRVGYDGDIYLTIVLNGFIHTVMYTYYFVAMHTKNIWWKKYLTSMQMVQFLTMNAQAIYMIATNCQRYPQRVTQAYLIYIQSLFWLFLNFFIKSYVQKPAARTHKKIA